MKNLIQGQYWDILWLNDSNHSKNKAFHLNYSVCKQIIENYLFFHLPVSISVLVFSSLSLRHFRLFLSLSFVSDRQLHSLSHNPLNSFSEFFLNPILCNPVHSKHWRWKSQHLHLCQLQITSMVFTTIPPNLWIWERPHKHLVNLVFLSCKHLQ